MEQALKERLVGAVVIVGLAVVLLPLVLDGPDAPVMTPAPAPDVPAMAEEADGSRTYRYDLDAPAPAGEGVSTAPLAAAPTLTEAAQSPGVAPSPAVSAPATATPPATAQPAASRPSAKPAAPATVQASEPAAPRGDSAWAAQAGTFSKAATARDLAARLQHLGFKAFVMEVRDAGRTLHRVRVGPVASRAEAEALAQRITRQARLEARPVPHP